MRLWGRGRGNSWFLHAVMGRRPGDLFPTNCNSNQILSHYILYLFFSVFLLSVLASLFFSLFFLFSPSHLTLCIGSGVLAVMWFCLNTIAGVCHWLIFLWKSVGFPGDGEWRHHFTFLRSCPPTPLPPLCIALSLPLSVSPTGCARSGSTTHTQTVTGLCRSSSCSPSSPFSSGRQSLRPLDCSRWVKQMALFVEI